MPRSIQDILDHADELARRFEEHEPDEGNEVPVEEYLLCSTFWCLASACGLSTAAPCQVSLESYPPSRFGGWVRDPPTGGSLRVHWVREY